MKKLLELPILVVAITGFSTVKLPLFLNSPMPFFSPVNSAQKDSKIQTKYFANNQTNDNIKSDIKKSINPAKLPLNLSNSPKRPLIDTYLNKSSPEKEIHKLPPNNIQEDPKFEPVMEYAIKHNLAELPMAEIIQAIADYFIGTPYKAGLLDQSKQESLVITLDRFDCVLFVETVLAMARGIAIKDYSYLTFINHIRDQRYRQGKMNGYCSRLHYFSEWITDNQKRGNVRDIGFELGGEMINKPLFFMSKNRDKYSQIARNNTNYQCIATIEDSISQQRINYIPYYKISSVYSQLQPGDIIALATEINGLDVTHAGLVYRNSDNNIGLIHASPRAATRMLLAIDRYLQEYNMSVADVFVIVGKDKGILDERKQLPRFAIVKSGTLDYVSALVGALPTKEKGVIWFTIMNQGSSIMQLRNQQEILLKDILKKWGTVESLPLELTANPDRKAKTSRSEIIKSGKR